MTGKFLKTSNKRERNIIEGIRSAIQSLMEKGIIEIINQDNDNYILSGKGLEVNSDKKKFVVLEQWEMQKIFAEYTKEEMELLKDTFLLTLKPILYVANISEEQLEKIDNDTYINEVRKYAQIEKAKVIPLCVKIEEELSILENEDKIEMLEALGLKEAGLDKVIKASYDLLG